ncbi:Photosystem I assembly protein Ycf3 [Frankliniella fusca]|uniref:Photosystem I assembly protein Ycf3 n=1 Tax=Frankliniella fusca TaxID=407009 RepID=A0AAE1H584_9NEOP|nr:Photosystem I assembly protein Ycf3 [Frankliniella fusca]
MIKLLRLEAPYSYYKKASPAKHGPDYFSSFQTYYLCVKFNRTGMVLVHHFVHILNKKYGKPAFNCKLVLLCLP